jgi:hypothetical protein
MGPGRRLVVVREADALKPDGIEALKAYVANPIPHVHRLQRRRRSISGARSDKTLAAGATS